MYFEFRQNPDGQPQGQWPAFYHEVNKHPIAHVKVLNAEQYHTDRQRRWYRGVCLKGLADWNGDSVDQWDIRLKTLCGSELFKFRSVRYDRNVVIVPDSISNRTKRQMTQFIENILAKAIEMEWPVYPPDPDLRRQT